MSLDFNSFLDAVKDLNGYSLAAGFCLLAALAALGVMAYGGIDKGYRIGFLDGYLRRKKDDKKAATNIPQSKKATVVRKPDPLPEVDEDDEYAEIDESDDVDEVEDSEAFEDEEAEDQVTEEVAEEDTLPPIVDLSKKKVAMTVVRKKPVVKAARQTISEAIKQKSQLSKQRNQGV